MQKTRQRKIISAALAVLAAAAIFGVFYLARVYRYQNQLRNITFSEIRISALPDGEYTGAYDADLVAAQVSVTVKDGAVIAIRLLEHKQERGTAAERITEEIIAQQRVDVDAVTGATNSSKVIQKAIENALLQAADNR